MKPSSNNIADVQGSQDLRNLAINKVGIKSIRHPIKIIDRDNVAQHTVAVVDMFAFLSAELKGTHMSRFVEILNEHDEAISIESFEAMVRKTLNRLETTCAYIEMRFPYFKNKAAPISGVRSFLDYDVTLIGEIKTDGGYEQTIKILVPVTSLCPCSKEISQYGAHNQRSHVTVSVKVNQHIWFDELIDTVESLASCALFGLLKRPDEKYVTERAYENPKFVEDVVRDIAMQFNQDERINNYIVESENFESIHNHSAYALIEHDKRF